MKGPQVILVDEKDRELGLMDKMEAHEKALLHRAISVFIFNSKGEWLLQRRDTNKYHSGGLWTNATCSHPLPGEPNHDAASRRLMEELGIQCGLSALFSFIYKEKLDNGLTEHELDHVFYGVTDQEPVADPREVMDWKYTGFDDLKKDMVQNPENYTVWFKKIADRVQQSVEKTL
ncbi:MAG: isopentenyl-diphosphate Delta-isomerase [Bacteroidales bacterium]|nr:isopentenyl-diphosphate Delta-isomerase [Bacteroidales bacterium]